MLKNKFGMATRVLLIVLSVLMAVSLAACKKGDTIDPDQMNSAIQSAIDAANKAQAEKDAALASSIAADKAAQEAKDAANAASIAADKAKNDEALKKAEEAAAAAKKAADDAAKKAAEQEAALKKAQDEAAAAKKAAEEAAKKAADEAAKAAEKAAAEAAAKAAEEAAAALKAQEEALKKAQEEAAAAKAAAEAAASQAAADKAALEEALKKALEEAEAAKKAAEEAKEKAEAASSKLEETTVAPETTVVPDETTTQAPETTTKAPETTAPVVIEDTSDVLEAFSRLKTNYTIIKRDMYNDADYEELILLFDKASVDLNNAKTVEAAESIYRTLDTDAAAVRNVENAAAEVAALVNGLKDIETEVFTTQADMILEAQKAYAALKVEYYHYLDCDEKGKDLVDGKTVKIATELGINVADLEKADAKLEVLSAYIADTLNASMKSLYLADTRLQFRADTASSATIALVENAYYQYLVLSVINGGDVAAADLEVNWEFKVDDDGNVVRAKQEDLDKNLANKLGVKYGLNDRVYDDKKPTDWFTAEDFIEIFALPTLDYKFEQFKAELSDLSADSETGLKAVLTAHMAAIVNAIDLENIDADDEANYLMLDTDVRYMIDDAAYAFADEIANITFVDDYKTTATLEDAKADIRTKFAVAYINAINSYVAESKTIAADYYTLNVYEADLLTLEGIYSQDKYQNDVQQAYYEKKVAKVEADKDAFLANVDATPVYDWDALNALEVRAAIAGENADPYKELAKYITAGAIDDKFYEYVDAAVVAAINDNFVVTVSGESVLGDYILALVEDLTAFRARLDPTDETQPEDYKVTGIYELLRGNEITYLKDSAAGYKDEIICDNTTKFTAMVATIDQAIADIEAIDIADYPEKDVALKVPSTFKDHAKSKDLYWLNADAQKFVMSEVTDDEGNINYAKLEETVWNDIKGKSTNTSWKNGSLVSITPTAGLEITYVQSSDAQACAKAYEIYEAAYKSIHTEIQALQKSTKTYQDKIDNYQPYKDVKANVKANAELLAEVNALATTYKNKIAAENELKKTMTDDGFGGKPTVDHTVNVTHFALNEIDNNAAEYSLTALDNNMNPHVTTFKALFGEDNIVQLYNYRNEVIAKLETLVADYFNKYVDDPATDEKVEADWQQAKYGWQYDMNATAVSTKGAEYEAQAKKLLNTCITNIKNVKIDSNADVKDYLNTDAKIYTKAGASLANAKNMINANVVKLLGYTMADEILDGLLTSMDLYATGTTWTDSLGNSYSNANSEIFSAYKVYYAGNYETLNKDTKLTADKATMDNGEVATKFTVIFVDENGDKLVKTPNEDPALVEYHEYTFTAGAEDLELPEVTVPAKEGFTANWTYDEDWASTLAGKTVYVQATYTEIEYVTITFLDATGAYVGDPIKVVKGTAAKDVDAPDFPAGSDKEGFKTVWVIDTTKDSYATIDYIEEFTVTYKGAGEAGADVVIDVLDGEIIDSTEIPAVPAKDNNTGAWNVDLTNVAITQDYEIEAEYTPYYTVTFVTMNEDGSAVATTHATYYFQMGEEGYEWITPVEDSEVYTEAPAVPELANNLVIWNKADLEKVDLSKVSATEPANIQVKAEYVEYRTATYYNFNGSVNSEVKYTVEGKIVEIVDGAFEYSDAPAAGTGYEWTFDIADVTEETFVNRIINKVKATVTNP